MVIEYNHLFSQAQPKNLVAKIGQFPLIRILLILLFLLPYLLIRNNLVADLIASTKGILNIFLLIVDAAVSFLVILMLYRLYTKLIEKRKAMETSAARSLSELGIGLLISLGIVGFMVLLMTCFGYYHILGLNSPDILFTSLFFFGMGAFIQVMAFRLVLFKCIEELLGSWLTFILVAGVFAFVHLGNPQADLWSTTALIIADVLLFAAFVYTRRLWLVWGIHWGWNFFQDGIFGMPNSGITEFKSWIQPTIKGPEWITGGHFGIEASVIAVFLSLLVGLVILKKAMAEKQIVPPIWKRRR